MCLVPGQGNEALEKDILDTRQKLVTCMRRAYVQSFKTSGVLQDQDDPGKYRQGHQKTLLMSIYHIETQQNVKM